MIVVFGTLHSSNHCEENVCFICFMLEILPDSLKLSKCSNKSSLINTAKTTSCSLSVRSTNNQFIVFSLSSRSSWRSNFSPAALARSPSLLSANWKITIINNYRHVKFVFGSFEIRYSPVNVILQICHFFPLSLHSTLESNKHLYQVLKSYFQLSQSTEDNGISISQCWSQLDDLLSITSIFIFYFCNGMINLTPWPCKRTFFYIFYNDLEIVRNFSSRLIVRRFEPEL